MRAGAMLWNLNPAQWHFCLLEGVCQSLEEAPGEMGQSATEHTHHLSPLWDKGRSQTLPRSLSMEAPRLVPSS